MSYTLSHSADTGDGAMLDTNCVEDYLQIPGNLHNYFNLHICPSLRQPVLFHFTIAVVGSQNVTNESWLVCVKSEKYAFWVTLIPGAWVC